MGAHVALEVKVGQLFSASQLEEGRQLGVRINASTIGLILKLIGADIRIDLTRHFRAGHFRALGFTQERSQFIADEGRLHEAARGAIASLALALRTSLSRGLQFARGLLLQGAEFSLERRDQRSELLQLGHEIGKLA